ncbi:MAG: hypothetical protein AAGD38_09600 [Acidobacteriota bacterium]
MPFAKFSTSNERNTPVADKLVSEMNLRVKTPAQTQIAKLAISDQGDGDARGVLYYWTDNEPPVLKDSPTQWAHHAFTDNEDYDDAYKHVLEVLNGQRAIDGVTLTLQQAAAAKVGFANRKKGDFHLTLFFPSQMSP